MTKPAKKKRPWSSKKRSRRHKDKRVPLIATVGAIGGIFAGRPGSMSLGGWLVNSLTNQQPNIQSSPGPNMVNMTADTIAQYTGYDYRNGTWGIPTGLLVTVGSALASKAASKFAPKPFDKIPIIGKYLKL